MSVEFHSFQTNFPDGLQIMPCQIGVKIIARDQSLSLNAVNFSIKYSQHSISLKNSRLKIRFLVRRNDETAKNSESCEA